MAPMRFLYDTQPLQVLGSPVINTGLSQNVFATALRPRKGRSLVLRGTHWGLKYRVLRHRRLKAANCLSLGEFWPLSELL